MDFNANVCSDSEDRRISRGVHWEHDSTHLMHCKCYALHCGTPKSWMISIYIPFLQHCCTVLSCCYLIALFFTISFTLLGVWTGLVGEAVWSLLHLPGCYCGNSLWLMKCSLVMVFDATEISIRGKQKQKQTPPNGKKKRKKWCFGKKRKSNIAQWVFFLFWSINHPVKQTSEEEGNVISSFE